MWCTPGVYSSASGKSRYYYLYLHIDWALSTTLHSFCCCCLCMARFAGTGAVGCFRISFGFGPKKPFLCWQTCCSLCISFPLLVSLQLGGFH